MDNIRLDSGDRRMRLDERKQLLLLCLTCCLLVSVPFLLVRITPVADLPQQLAQIPLLFNVLSGNAPDLVVHWEFPNKLSYPLLAISWLLFEPLLAARAAVILVALVWVGSIFVLARSRRRPLAAAIVAVPFLFNHSFGLGFLNFAVGFGAFTYWFLVLVEPPEDRHSKTIFLQVLLGSLLLYYSHALWLLAGIGWLFALSLWQRRPWRVLLAQALGAAPTLVLAWIWYPQFVAMHWGDTLVFAWPTWSRLSLSSWVNSAFGCLRGPFEPLMLSLVLLWLLFGLWLHRKRMRDAIDLEMLLTGCLFLVAALLLPDKVDRTTALASRWIPLAAVFSVLALPPPNLDRRVLAGVAIGMLALFVGVTSVAWLDFEEDELAGLFAGLEQLPDDSRLLGLDFVRDSPRIKYPVYLHMPAYGQLLRGGEISFSFANLASSLVVQRDFSVSDPWTQGLEWRPDRLEPDDLDHFDYVLMLAPPQLQNVMLEQVPRLVPQTPADHWRLFRILPRTPPSGQAGPADEQP